MTKVTLTGLVPSKKNSRINTRSGRSFPSSKYTAWHKDASTQLVGAYRAIVGGTVTITFISGDLRKFDLSNKAESIMDLFVDVGILEDDNYSVVPTLILKYGGYEKGNHHVVIEYEKKEETI